MKRCGISVFYGIIIGITMSFWFFACVDNVPVEKPMDDYCKKYASTLMTYDTMDFKCSNYGEFSRKIL